MQISKDLLKKQVIDKRIRYETTIIENNKTITLYETKIITSDLYIELVNINNYFIELASNFLNLEIPYPNVIVRPTSELTYNKDKKCQFSLALACACVGTWTVEYNLESLLNTRHCEFSNTDYLGYGVQQTFKTFVPHEIAHLISLKYLTCAASLKSGTVKTISFPSPIF